MDKHYEAVKEILEDQIKKIAKKGDISPQELDSLYKASAVVLDFETKEAMKKAEQGQSQEGGQSNRNGSYNSYENSNRSSYNRGSYEGGNSNHYPWFMTPYGRSFENSGNSYGPVWNQEEPYMGNHPMNEEMSKEYRGNSREQGRGRNSRESYANAYEGAYDGAYDGSYEGSYDGSYDGSMDASNDSSYRRGRDARTGRYVSRDNRGYSRAMDKERMIGKLQDMMDDAPSEKERRTLQQCVDRLERQ